MIDQQENPNQLDEVLKEATAQINQPASEVPSRSSINLSGLRETLLNYIVPLVSILLTLVVGLFVLLPSYKSLPQLQMEIESKRMLRSNLNTKIINLNKLVDFNVIVEENSTLVSKVLVSEELVPGLLTQVDKITQESGLTINRLNYGLGVTTEIGDAGEVTYNYVTVNLGANGTPQQLMTFLKNLEVAARIINIDMFRYSLNESDDGNFLGMNFVLVSPYLFVESNAVTDEAIDLDIADPTFVDLINKLKNMKYYDPTDINFNIEIVEETDDDKEIFEEEIPAPEGTLPAPVVEDTKPDEVVTNDTDTVLTGGN